MSDVPPTPRLQNVVATFDTGHPIDLAKMVSSAETDCVCLDLALNR